MAVSINNKNGTTTKVATNVKIVKQPANHFMTKAVYDPNGEVSQAGGIPEYVAGEIEKIEGGGSQVSGMPTPSVDNLGKVVQYIGASYGGVIKGHFYKCESNGATTPVYSWVDITNEHTISLHKHTATSDMYLPATHVWVPKNTPIPANSNAIVTIIPRANKSYIFMLMQKNSETSYTIIEQFSGTADANGTPVTYPVSKSTEDRYIGLYTSDAGLLFNSASGNANKEYMMKAEYGSFVDGTSDAFEQQASTLDFSYELALEKSVRIGNVYYPVIVDGSGHGDCLTISDAVKGTRDGDIIYICKGIYDESIDIRNHPRHFIGESKDNTFWVKSSDDYSLPPLNMTGGIVENLTIIAGYGLTPTYEAHRTPYAIHADSGDSVSHELIVRNCNLISNVSAAVGLGVRWNQKMTIQNCYLESNAEKTYSNGSGAFFQQGALYLHNDANLKESTAFLSVENCEIKGVKNAVAIQANNSGSTLAVRFLDNAMWSADNGTTDAVNIMQTPTDEHLAGSVVDLDAVSFGNNAEVLNAIVTVPTGGTTGQVLVKSSDADYETEWGNVTSDDVVIPSGLTEIYNISHTTVDSWLSTYVTFEDDVLTEKAHPTSVIGAHYQITDADLVDYDLRAKIRVNVVNVSGEWTCRLEYTRYDGTKASWAIPFGTITQAGEIVLEIDLANLSAYYNYAGGGVDFRVMNASHGENDTIVINVIDTLVGDSLDLGGDNVTEVLETLSTNLGDVSVDITNLKGNGLSLTAPNGYKYKLVVANDGTLSTALDYPNNILYIGNSLLLGFGTHGMASTTVNDDYYAKVNDFIENKGVTLTTDRVLGKPLEETTSSEEVQTWITNNLASKMSASVQMVIIQLGDNVNTYQQREFFPSSMETLVNYLRQNCPNAKLAWVGCWYSGSSIDNILIPKCIELSVPFVSIDGLFNVEGNQSYIGAPYIDASGNEKTVTTAGQASHPSDQGFTAIANRIIDALFT